MKVALSDIVKGPNRARAGSEPRRVRELADAIKASGWISPVVLRMQPEGLYEIVAGHRRVAAARLLGLDCIPAELADDDSADVINLAENTREDVHPVDRGLGWLESLKLGHRVSEVAALSGCSAAQVSRLTAALRRLHPDVIAHYRKRECTAALLISLSWQSEAKQLRAIAAGHNPQRSTTRSRTRRARDIRTAIRELKKQPRSEAREAQLRALCWAVRERDAL